jgi:hypothetical protein
MSDFPTYSDFFEIARDAMLAYNDKISREMIERDGSDANVIAAADSAVGDEVVGQLARVCSALTLGTSRRRALDKLIYDRYGLLRNAASPAQGSVVFTTTNPTAGSFAIPKNTKLTTPDGIVFYTIVAATFPSGSVGPVTVQVQSTAAGVSQAATVGTITSIVDTIPSAPDDLAVNNPLATAGAVDEESDEAYIDRARLFFSTVRRGTSPAIQEQALRYPGVTRARGLEVLDDMGRPAKLAQLIITDQYTDKLATLDAVPPTYATQSQVLAQAVFASLYDTRPIGVYIDVMVAKVIMQPVVLALSFAAGANADLVAYMARVAVVNAVNSLNPGETLTSTIIVNALRDVRNLIVSGDEVLSPAGDVVPTALEVLRTTLGLVRASTVQPDMALAGTSNPDAV